MYRSFLTGHVRVHASKSDAVDNGVWPGSPGGTASAVVWTMDIKSIDGHFGHLFAIVAFGIGDEQEHQFVDGQQW